MRRWKDVNWNGVFDGQCVAFKLFMRSGLVRKDLLVRFASPLLPPSFVVCSFEQLTQVVATAPCTKWVLKLADSSNANGLLLVDSTCAHQMEQIRLLMQCESDAGPANTPVASTARVRVLQKYVEPQLIHARKSHFRVLLLVVGDLQVFVCSHVRVLLASKPFDTQERRWGDDRKVHITNHSVNVEPGVRACATTLNMALEEVFEEPQLGQLQQQIESVCYQLIDGVRGAKRFFLPLPNCCEVFGLDLALDCDDRLWLLEANPDPSLRMLPVQVQRKVRRTLLTLPVDAHADGKRFRRLTQLEEWRLVLDAEP